MRPTVPFTPVRRIGSSNVVKLSFLNGTAPDYVTVGHTRFNGFLYVNKPRQCSKCGRFGHANSVCNKKERCSRCDGKHQHDTCDAEVPWRPNCKKQHEATSHQFSVYETARYISTYESANNVDYRSARSVVKPSSVKAQSSECDLHPRQSKNLKEASKDATIPPTSDTEILYLPHNLRVQGYPESNLNLHVTNAKTPAVKRRKTTRFPRRPKTNVSLIY